MKRRRLAPLAGLGVTAICVVIAGLVVGLSGVVGALVGGAIVGLFFASTPAVLGPVAKTSPGLSLLFAMVFFLTKVVALVALFVVLTRASEQGGPIDAESVSVTVIVTTLAWLVARIVDATRERTPMYDLPHSDQGEPDRFDSQ